jgi:predicted Zn-dependent protease with MMP-like domain
MNSQLRQYFDEQVDWVLERVPQRVHDLLDEVTMYVEDHPPRRVMQQLGVRRRDQLCGLYTGIPLTQRHVEISGVLSDAIYIYREGILSMATDRRGNVDEDELRYQIRITILHELGHHHGIDEDELRELGY